MGVGNPLCADDAAGMLFAERVRAEAEKAGALVMAASTAPENFTGPLRSFRPDALYIVDAADMGERPGTAAVIPEEAIRGTPFSTHMLPLSFLIAYLRAEIGCRMRVIGVQPASVEPGRQSCEAVRAAADCLAEAFLEALRAASDAAS